MYYEIYGAGEPLILIIGVGGNLTRWFRNVQGLSKEYQVIAFDNRGMGRTDVPDIPYSIEMMADDTAGLMDAIGIDKAHLFGISMGGAIGQWLAIRHPEKLISLMLGCTLPGGSQSISGERGAASAALSSGITPEERARQGLPLILSEAFIENNPDIVDEIVQNRLLYPPDPIGFRRQVEALNAHDAYDRLPEIKIPTLILHGSDDRLIPVDNGRVIASQIPNAELVILEGRKHCFFQESPDEVSRIILDFLRRHSAQKAR